MIESDTVSASAFYILDSEFGPGVHQDLQTAIAFTGAAQGLQSTSERTPGPTA